MIQAVIFDLDGVIVSTDEYHFQAWQRLAHEEEIPFTEKDNEQLKGVSRMDSLEIILKQSQKNYTAEAKVEMAERKNLYYRDLLKNLSPSHIHPGVLHFLKSLERQGIRVAIGSSSKNAVPILHKLGLIQSFEAVADGTNIKKSKPDPEVFLLAASLLSIPPTNCLVVEDAEAGVDAGLAAGMKVLAVGSASSLEKATFRAKDLSHITTDQLLR